MKKKQNHDKTSKKRQQGEATANNKQTSNMVLNYIWIAFILLAIVASVISAIIGNSAPMGDVMNAMFSSAKTGFEISIGLTGVLALWLGFLKIAERSGVTDALARAVSPFFRRIFPEIPKDHPAMGTIFMNLSANMLGLDNAATPLGLKAMEELQTLNKQKDTATNAMIMFLVLNTSGLTLIPITVMTYRAQFGAINPADVFLPILIATYFSSLVGLIGTAIVQKINLFKKEIIFVLGGLTALIIALLYGFTKVTPDTLTTISNLITYSMLLLIVGAFILCGAIKRVNVYEAFIEGAKEGFKIAVGIIPYLIAILVAIGMFRASGGMDFLLKGMAAFFEWMGMDTRFVDAMPTAIMKPLSGSGARGMMLDAMGTHGADSFAGRLSCILQGATDTTFYILALYFGSVKITKMRHALPCGLLADLAGILAAIFISYLFFG